MQVEDLEAVRVFVQVVQSASFTAAAKQLGLPKSTVSRRVAQLEAQLGVRLLHRTTRKLSLTDAGELYFSRASGVIMELEAAERDVLTMQASPRGRLRITAPADFSSLAAVVSRFQSAHPEVEVFASMTQRRVDLVGEGFDLALRAGPLDDSTLIARRLAMLRSGLYASPDYLAAHGEPTDTGGLSGHRLVLFSRRDNRGMWTLFDASGEATVVAVDAALAGDDYAYVHNAVLSGAGIGLLPFFIGQPSVAAGTLRRVLPGIEGPHAPLNAVYPSPQHLTPKVRAFIDFASEALDTGSDLRT